MDRYASVPPGKRGDFAIVSAADSPALDIAKLRPWLEVRFARSAGPGGQHVNKVSTQVVLLLDFEACTLFTREQKRRVRVRWCNRLASDGRLRVVRRRERSQARNRRIAEVALIELLADAFHVPKHRISTTPTRAAVRRRLEAKRRRSLTKSRRGVVEREP